VGRVLRSPFSHARLKSIDTSAAKRIPGVMAVVTAEDTPKVKFGAVEDEYALAVDEVRYIGEEVAAVAAIDADTAAAALEAIKVEYEELPSVYTLEEAVAAGAPLVHQDRPGNVAFHIDVRRGDVERALAEADLIIEDDFVTPEDHHCYIETLNATASHDNGHLTIWTGVQGPLRIRIVMAGLLGISPSQIRMICPMIGGTFGGKSGTNFKPAVIAALLAIKAGMPVRVAHSRAEDLYAGRHQAGTQAVVKTAWKKDGTLLARVSKLLQDAGAYSGAGLAVMKSTAVRGDDLYKIHAMHTVADLVYTNKTPAGHMRGFGVPQALFPLETLFDRAAHRLGIDPIDLRLHNAVEAGDAPSLHGRIYKSCGLKECMTVAKEKSRWKELRPLQPDDKRFRKGVGMANVVHVSGNAQAFTGFDGATVYTRLEEDGRVSVCQGYIEGGQGSNTVFGQITSEVLDLPLSEIVVYNGDSLCHAFDPGLFGNRGTFVVGNAVKLAAEDLKRKMIECFAADENVATETVDLSKWEFRFGENSNRKPVPVKDIARKLLYARRGEFIQGVGVFENSNTSANQTTLYGNISGAYCFGSEVVEVEVDTWTGIVRILDVCAVFDIGTPLNEKSAEGQVEGGIVHATGWVLSESVARDGKGRMLNANFTDYKLPTALDAPPMKVYFVGKPDPLGPFGAKSVGQAPTCPIPPAVVNAIYHATGVLYPEYPVDPEKLLRRLEEAR
jgi:CO/xanthine dehydrogenase Mo-binding subunit